MTVWLHTNRRAPLAGLIVAALVELCGTFVLMGGFFFEPAWLWWMIGGVMSVAGTIAVVSLALVLARPRIAHADGHILFYLRHDGPIRVPLEVVEGFLLGQGHAWGEHGAGPDWETSTLVVKLAEKFEDWARVEVEPALAAWCNHYVTIRGTWCEPLSVEVVGRLNARLAEVAPPRRAGERA